MKATDNSTGEVLAALNKLREMLEQMEVELARAVEVYQRLSERVDILEAEAPRQTTDPDIMH
jgi:hypothetical protein